MQFNSCTQEYILLQKEFSKNHRTSSDNTDQLFLLQNMQEKNAQISASWDCYRWFSALFLQTKIIYQVFSYKSSTQCPARGMNFVCQTVSFGFKFLTSGWPMRTVEKAARRKKQVGSSINLSWHRGCLSTSPQNDIPVSSISNFASGYFASDKRQTWQLCCYLMNKPLVMPRLQAQKQLNKQLSVQLGPENKKSHTWTTNARS